ncbi:MAG: hypothetical protein L6R43_02935 [Planctomycetes bacterium]|nr:hypothetical protein [Planctomycetota bacterium]
MAANSQVIRMLQKQRGKLEGKVAQAEQSIAGWKGQMDSLDGAIAALGGAGRRAGRTGAKGRKRGTWKPGGRGRPPQWYVDQQRGKRAKGRKAAKAGPAKRMRRVSAKVLAGLAKAREVLAAKRAARKPAAK